MLHRKCFEPTCRCDGLTSKWNSTRHQFLVPEIKKNRCHAWETRINSINSGKYTANRRPTTRHKLESSKVHERAQRYTICQIKFGCYLVSPLLRKHVRVKHLFLGTAARRTITRTGEQVRMASLCNVCSAELCVSERINKMWN